MPHAPRVAINGFGRIGRLVARALLTMDRPVRLVAVNDLADGATLAHLFAHDSVHGPWSGQVKSTPEGLSIDGQEVRLLRQADPADLPWGKLGIDVVVEATGRFRSRGELQRHLDAGAKRVLLTAPPKDAIDAVLVRGVNADTFDPARHQIVSNASCTTNCLAPVLKVLDEAFGVEHAAMTTVHAYTNDQHLVDAPTTDLRRARAAALSMIPTSTGAASAIGDVIPTLAGRVDGLAIRVPLANVSLVDLTARLARDVTVEELRNAFRAAAAGPLDGILGCDDVPLVSVDHNHDARSAVVDEATLAVVGGRMAKVLAWYDNEWAYSMRTAELVHQMVATGGRAWKAGRPSRRTAAAGRSAARAEAGRGAAADARFAR